MVKKDIQQINRLMSKIKVPDKKHKFPKKDADSTTALSPKTLSALEEVIGKFNNISTGHAEIIQKIVEKMLVSDETKILEENYKKLSTVDTAINEISKSLESLLSSLGSIKEQVEGGYGIEELIDHFKGQDGKTISVHLDNADNLEKPQPVIVSLGDDFKQMVKTIEKVRSPEIVIKEDKKVVEAISKLENKLINTTTTNKSKEPLKIFDVDFVRDGNNLTQKCKITQIQ